MSSGIRLVVLLKWPNSWFDTVNNFNLLAVGKTSNITSPDNLNMLIRSFVIVQTNVIIKDLKAFVRVENLLQFIYCRPVEWIRACEKNCVKPSQLIRWSNRLLYLLSTCSGSHQMRFPGSLLAGQAEAGKLATRRTPAATYSLQGEKVAIYRSTFFESPSLPFDLR